MVRMTTASAQHTMSAWLMSMTGIAVANERQSSTAIIRPSIPARAAAPILLASTPFNLAWRSPYAQGLAESIRGRQREVMVLDSTVVVKIKRLRIAVLLGVVVMTAGRVIDLQWHATHPEFETGGDQIQAHWLAWLGAVVLLAASIIGVASRRYRSPGFLILFGSAWLYAGVAFWHFRLHQQLRDPDLPHALLALSQLGLYIGTAFIGVGLIRPKCREKYILSRA